MALPKYLDNFFRSIKSRTRIGIPILLLLCSAACANFSPVPPAGMKYLKSLSAGTLQRTNPQNVRVAINLPEGIVIKDLSLDLSGKQKIDHLKASLPFHVVPRTLAAEPKGGSGRWTYYALTQSGERGFRKIQAFASHHPSGGVHTKVDVKIPHKLALEDCGREGSMPLKVAIMLNPKRGYVTIWDYAVPLSKLAKPKDRICPSGAG